MSFADLLGVFGGAIVLGAIAAPALALGGSQLFARSEELQLLCLLQGMSLVHIFLDHLQPTFAMSILVVLSVAFTMSLDFFSVKKSPQKPGVLLAIYLILLSGTFLSLSLFPHADAHSLKSIFGDLVTVSSQTIKILIPIFAMLLLYFIVTYRSQARQLFERQMNHSKVRSRVHLGVLGVSVGVSVYFMGGLFAMTFMVIAPALTVLLKLDTLGRFRLQLVLLSSFAAVSGFAISLLRNDLPTTPTIALTLTAAVLCIFCVQQIIKYSSRKEAL